MADDSKNETTTDDLTDKSENKNNDQKVEIESDIGPGLKKRTIKPKSKVGEVTTSPNNQPDGTGGKSDDEKSKKSPSDSTQPETNQPNKTRRKELKNQYKQEQIEKEQARAMRGDKLQNRHQDINQRQMMGEHKRPIHPNQNRLDDIKQREPDPEKRQKGFDKIKNFAQKGQRIQALKNEISEKEQPRARRILEQGRLTKRKMGRALSMAGTAKALAKTGSKIGTARILQLAWLNLIDSFGLTLIYINFHFVMAYLGGPFSEYFCKFGEEWVPKSDGMAAASGGKGKGMFGAGSKALELVEIIGLFVLDAIVGVVFLILTFILYQQISLYLKIAGTVTEIFLNSPTGAFINWYLTN